MSLSTSITVLGFFSGNICGFLAKQYVLINGLEVIRKTVDEVVSEVAKRRFGMWLGTIFGFQASLVLALPVASFIGDIVWACVCEVVQSTIFCTAKVTGIMKQSTERISSAVYLSLRVFASIVSFSAKALIQRYAFPYVSTFIEASLPKLLPLFSKYAFLRFYLKPFLSLGGAMVLTTPAILLLGDIVGLLIQGILIYAAMRYFKHS